MTKTFLIEQQILNYALSAYIFYYEIMGTKYINMSLRYKLCVLYLLYQYDLYYTYFLLP